MKQGQIPMSLPLSDAHPSLYVTVALLPLSSCSPAVGAVNAPHCSNDHDPIESGRKWVNTIPTPVDGVLSVGRIFSFHDR